MYDTTYTTTLTNSEIASAAGGLAAVGIVFIIAYLIALVAAYVIFSLILSRIFKKAGVSPGIAWIPIYNTWKIYELGDQKGFWALLMFIPGVNIASAVFYYIALHNIGKKFGKDDWFIILAIFVPIVWFLIIAFDKSVWNGGSNAAPALAPADANTAAPSPVTLETTEQMAPAETPAPETEVTAPEVPETPVMPATDDQPAETATEPTDSDTEQ